MKIKYNVLIIGAGKIGAFFDYPGAGNILTHAHAFTSHKGFNLLGFVDTDMRKSRKAAAVWGGKSFSDIDEAFSCGNVDVVSVAVPDELHFRILKYIAKFPLKLVFAEKPLAKNVSEASEIRRLYKKMRIPVLVNYIRRFVPEFEDLKEDIKSGKCGKYLAGQGFYGKGLLHNGSHAVDLLRFFLGEFIGAAPINQISDFSTDDKSVSCALFFKDRTYFLLNCIDRRIFSIFEMDLIFEKKRVRIIDSGFKIEEYMIAKNRMFKGYKNMVKTKERNTSLNKSLFYSATNIYNYLTRGDKLKCTLDDGFMALAYCAKIKESNEKKNTVNCV